MSINNLSRAGILILVVIAVMAGIGVAYACQTGSWPGYGYGWDSQDSECYFVRAVSNDDGASQNIGDYSPVDPADNGLDPSTNQNAGEPAERYEYNVAATSAWVGYGQNRVDIALSNAYPGYTPTVYFMLNNDLQNWMVQTIQIENDPAVEFALTGISEAAPIEQSGLGGVRLSITDEAVPQGRYNFTITMTAVQYYAIPEAPTNLTATAVSQHQINLGWQDNADNENYFVIERSKDNANNFTLIARVWNNTTGYEDNYLQAGSLYYYRVKAVNTIGESGYSNQASARTLTDPPLPPELSSPRNNSTLTNLAPQLRWQTSSSADSYCLQVAANFSFTNPVVDQSGLTSASYQLPSRILQPDRTYYWRVRAYNSGGYSEWSEVWHFKIIK